jgi:hypothetical protein
MESVGNLLSGVPRQQVLGDRAQVLGEAGEEVADLIGESGDEGGIGTLAGQAIQVGVRQVKQVGGANGAASVPALSGRVTGVSPCPANGNGQEYPPKILAVRQAREAVGGNAVAEARKR